MQAVLQLIARFRANKHTGAAGLILLIAAALYVVAQGIWPEWFVAHEKSITHSLHLLYMLATGYGIIAAGDGNPAPTVTFTSGVVPTATGPGFTFTQTPPGVCINPQPPTQGQ